ncbi:MAG: VOC family protein [Rhodospirillaceae bacterium]
MRLLHGLTGLAIACVIATSMPVRAEENTTAPLFTATPTILLRTPDPGTLSEFYIALGMKVNRVNSRGSVIFYHEDGGGSLEIVRMDPNTQPGGPKESRTQQGVVAIFETTDLEDVVRRAREANSPLIEKWTSSQADVSIYYIADWENNIFGYAPRNHNPNINTP